MTRPGAGWTGRWAAGWPTGALGPTVSRTQWRSTARPRAERPGPRAARFICSPPATASPAWSWPNSTVCTVNSLRPRALASTAEAATPASEFSFRIASWRGYTAAVLIGVNQYGQNVISPHVEIDSRSRSELAAARFSSAKACRGRLPGAAIVLISFELRNLEDQPVAVHLFRHHPDAGANLRIRSNPYTTSLDATPPRPATRRTSPVTAQPYAGRTLTGSLAAERRQRHAPCCAGRASLSFHE